MVHAVTCLKSDGSPSGAGRHLLETGFKHGMASHLHAVDYLWAKPCKTTSAHTGLEIIESLNPMSRLVAGARAPQHASRASTRGTLSLKHQSVRIAAMEADSVSNIVI